MMCFPPTKEKKVNYELLIIGAGPAGISLAVEAIAGGVNRKKIVILEATHEHSFSIRKFYPDNKAVTANYKGKSVICEGVMCLMDSTKQETLSLLDQAIETNEINVHYQERVHKIHQNDDGTFYIESDKGQYTAKTCAIAIGIFGRPNKPNYSIPTNLKDKVHFDITSQDISQSEVLVVGGGDSASEYVQYLVQKNNKVSLSYRKSDFSRMNSINLESLLELEKQEKALVLRKTDINSLEEEGEKVKVYFTSGEKRTYSNVVYALGGSTPENFLKSCGIDFDGKNPILTDGYETSVPGLFLIGDLSAGKKGGSIISAFNSSHKAMKQILKSI